MPMAEASPKSTRVGFIGAGVMGQSMCRRILAGGYAVTLYSRTRGKASVLENEGAVWVDSPRAVAQRTDVVFAIVGHPHDVREVFLGPVGVVPGANSGSILVDMTTSEPSLAVEIADAADARTCKALDAPVSGGDVGAKNGTLSIMVGGDVEALDAVRPILECMGKTIVHQGPPGAGQHTKMVNQILIAGALNGVCEALLYARKAGLDLKTVMESVGGGAAASWQLQNLGPRMIDRNFEPGFFAEHFAKDIAIALGEARRFHASLPGLALVGQHFNSLLAKGRGNQGTHALLTLLEELANLSAVSAAEGTC